MNGRCSLSMGGISSVARRPLGINQLVAQGRWVAIRSWCRLLETLVGDQLAEVFLGECFLGGLAGCDLFCDQFAGFGACDGAVSLGQILAALVLPVGLTEFA